MKIFNKMILSLVSIVLIFGIILTFAAYLDSERELKNINSLYEERGVSIAKTIDASIMNDAQLHNDSQTIVDRLMTSNLGVAVINIHGKAPDGIKMPGYWRGYWILASSTKSNVHLPSNAVDIATMDTNIYSIASYNKNGKPIVHVTYPLHDPSGKAIATAEIEFDMSAIQSQILKKSTNSMQILLFLTLLAIIATIFKHKGTLDDLENLVKERTSKLEVAFNTLKEIETARKQEIHHRIKNNLQVISSLLDLQAEKFVNIKCINYSDVLEAFKESQDRVISMALIHEELYKGGEFETLNFSQYVEDLSKNLLHTYKVGTTDIGLKLNLAENIFFDMDTAVPLGIIVNELVTNSLKHAFQGRDKGEIQIKLQREEIGSYIKSVNENIDSTTFELTVSDNGVGIPENFDIENLDSLGLQLVTSLVDQLDGELEIKRNNGTEFTIWFTVKGKNNPVSPSYKARPMQFTGI